MGKLHSTLKVSRCEPHKRDPVSMLGVHVRLDFKNEARHLVFFGADLPRLSRLWLWHRTIVSNAVHQFLYPEGVDCRAEPDRRKGSIQKGLMIEGRQQLPRHLDLFPELFEEVFGNMFC